MRPYIPIRLRWFIGAAIYCTLLIALRGCATAPPKPTPVPQHKFKDNTPKPTVLVDWVKLANGDVTAAMKMQAEDDKRIAELQKQHDWDQQTADMLYADKQAAIEEAAKLSQANIDRKNANAARMFWTGIGAGVLGIACFAVPAFGITGIPKIGGGLLIGGAALVFAPSLLDVAEPAVQIGSYAVVALLIGAGVIQLRNNWLNHRAGVIDAEAQNPADPLKPREAIAIKREMLPGYEKGFAKTMKVAAIEQGKAAVRGLQQ